MVVIVAAPWFFLACTRLGRKLLFVGRRRRIARLSGLHAGKLRFGALMAGSFLAAVAGTLIVAAALSIMVRRSETREPDIAREGD